MKDVKCPYCGLSQDICHDDGYGYDEDVRHQQECYGCHKTFVFKTYISFLYAVFHADCLNGAPHEYKITDTIPRFAGQAECTVCQYRRNLTPDERKAFGVPTYEEYLAEQPTQLANAVKAFHSKDTHAKA